MARGRLWSWSTGRVGVSRVRVYERSAGGPLQVEWSIQRQRYQRSLEYHTGLKVYDRRDAKRIAERLSRTLEQGHNRKLHELLFNTAPTKTLGELLGRLHQRKEAKWRATYRKDQERFRAFWLDKLGADVRLATVNAAVVESIVDAASSERKRPWTPATRNRYKRYIVDAYSFAEKKLKWLDSRSNLSAVEFEEPKSKGRSYTRAEIELLLPALEAVDLFAGWIGHVLWQTGRRLSATRTLAKKHVEVRVGHAVIRWPEETDKAGKEGASVVVGRAYELARVLHERPGWYMAGTAPPSLDVCEKEWMAAAEARAGIAHVKGRAWHGFKRRFATASKGLVNRDRQSGTLESTLRGTYEVDDDLAAKMDVAVSLAREVGAL